MQPIVIISGPIASGATAPPSSSDIKELSSDQIRDLALDFDQLARTFFLEEERLSLGGIVSAENEQKLRQVSLTRIRLENTASILGDVAFKRRIMVELTNYNNEILKSTEALKEAAAKIQSIRDSINDFVKVFTFIIDTVQKISTGGAFRFDSILETILNGLEIAGIKLT